VTDIFGIVLLEAFCLAGLARLAFVYHQESRPAPEPEYVYEPEHYELGGPLKTRRAHGGKSAMVLMIATPDPVDVADMVLSLPLADLRPGYVAPPPLKLRTRPTHVDWLDTQEIEIRWHEHFADQPDDRAVMKVGSHRA